MTSKPDIDMDSLTPEDVVSILGPVIGFWDEHIELIKNNIPAMKLFIELINEAEDVLMPPENDGSLQDEEVEAFREEFIEKLLISFRNDKESLPKRQLFGFFTDVFKEDIECIESPKEKKLIKEKIAAYEIMLNTTDPWVNFENKKYRYSRFMMLKRKACYIVEMPETGEYLAMDVEKLQKGFDKMKIPLKVKDLACKDVIDESLPPKRGGRKSTELEGLVFKTMCELVIANGEKKDEKKEEVKKEASFYSKAEEKIEQKVVELDPVAQAKLDKKKEANRKTRERKKAAKKAKKDQKAMDEKEDFKLEVVNEEGSSADSETAT
ncbi:unnamed protein product [Caenorhabditis brenneri]